MGMMGSAARNVDGAAEGGSSTGQTDSLPIYVVHQLRRILQKVQAQIADSTAGANITPPQLLILHELERHGPLTQNALGRVGNMDPATLHGVIQRLMARSLISRGRKPSDRRCMVVQITDEGSELLRACLDQIERGQKAALAPLNDTEAAVFMTLLKRIT